MYFSRFVENICKNADQLPEGHARRRFQEVVRYGEQIDLKIPRCRQPTRVNVFTLLDRLEGYSQNLLKFSVEQIPSYQNVPLDIPISINIPQNDIKEEAEEAPEECQKMAVRVVTTRSYYLEDPSSIILNTKQEIVQTLTSTVDRYGKLKIDMDQDARNTEIFFTMPGQTEPLCSMKGNEGLEEWLGHFAYLRKRPKRSGKANLSRKKTFATFEPLLHLPIKLQEFLNRSLEMQASYLEREYGDLNVPHGLDTDDEDDDDAEEVEEKDSETEEGFSMLSLQLRQVEQDHIANLKMQEEKEAKSSKNSRR